MELHPFPFQKVKVAYFSGTGGTAHVAGCFAQALGRRGAQTVPVLIRAGDTYENDGEDFLLLLFAVHAANAPEPVYTWLKSMGMAGAKPPAAVISVSGGGEISPNTACRSSSIRRLEKIGCPVWLEEMLIMPPNLFLETDPALCGRILNILPQKVERILNALETGAPSVKKTKLIDRFLSRIFEMEKLGCRFYARTISRTEACNGCGLCARECPGRNIAMENGKPRFQTKCLLCLRCIYRCPQKALRPRFAKKAVLSGGYDIAAMLKVADEELPCDIEKAAKGWLWKGVRTYLLEEQVTISSDTDISK